MEVSETTTSYDVHKVKLYYGLGLYTVHVLKTLLAEGNTHAVLTKRKNVQVPNTSASSTIV